MRESEGKISGVALSSVCPMGVGRRSHDQSNFEKNHGLISPTFYVQFFSLVDLPCFFGHMVRTGGKS